MKKIFTTIALLGAVILGVNAQKNVDLQLVPLYPVDGGEYANVASGDTVLFALEVTNAGTDTVDETDSVYIRYYNILQETSGSSYYVTVKYDSLNILPGTKDTMFYYFIQGENWGAGSTGDVFTVFPDNSLDTLRFLIYGRDDSGRLFTDPDIDVDTAGNATLTGNNNVSIVVTWGDLALFHPSLDRASIALFPNPTSTNINFEYNFDKVSTASVRVIDLLGRTVLTQDYGTQNVGNNKFTINVADLPNGLYTLEMTTEGKRAVSKFNVSK